MENNDNDLQRQPLIPEQRQQGKTVETILIKKNELNPLKCLYYIPFLSAIQRDSFLLITWIELNASY